MMAASFYFCSLDFWFTTPSMLVADLAMLIEKATIFVVGMGWRWRWVGTIHVEKGDRKHLSPPCRHNRTDGMSWNHKGETHFPGDLSSTEVLQDLNLRLVCLVASWLATRIAKEEQVGQSWYSGPGPCQQGISRWRLPQVQNTSPGNCWTNESELLAFLMLHSGWLFRQYWLLLLAPSPGQQLRGPIPPLPFCSFVLTGSLSPWKPLFLCQLLHKKLEV